MNRGDTNLPQNRLRSRTRCTQSKKFPFSAPLGGQADSAEMAYGPVRTPSTQQQPQNSLDDLSNSGPAVRLDREGWKLAPPEGRYR
jgi:hypothetical protein